ncbi:prenyltransferase [Thalassotalea sp. LPB0316]|uniref:prenyltransferase n=1 Tax=Thalassotalea sp. LPB0316 TaxID=2769490 RepID=UPI001866F6F8|nr:prenyltransferase [Thalassotalea sp. LPB0316]QOL24893.1 prenyltransferase [Thalassotalea sp. LPB0316]
MISQILPSARPPFLILAVVCVLLGTSIANFQGAELNSLHFALAIIGAICAAMSVNLLNEYSDFKSGLDANTKKTPFSGGSGWLIANPELSSKVFKAGLFAILVTSLIGIYFAYQYGQVIVIGGLIGLAIIASYTNILNKSAMLCLIAPGVGFGILMTLGSEVVQSGMVSKLGLWLSLIPFFQINNLLLLNQYPDIEADKQVGRNHFPIRYGINVSNIIYGLQLLASAVVLVYLIAAQMLPPLAAIAFLPMMMASVTFYGMVKYQSDVENKLQFFGLNAASANLTPLTLAIVLFVS